MDAYRSQWWLTPLWEVQSPFDKSFNESLLDELYSIAVSIRNGSDKDPHESLWDYDKPNLNILKDWIMKTVSEVVLTQIQEANELKVKLEFTGAWANVKEPGEAIEAHGHNDSSIAATYYVQAEEGAGDLVVLDTSELMDEKGLFANKETNVLGFKRIKPVAGKLAIVPAYCLHEVSPNKSNALRISISTDIKQVIDPTVPNAFVLKSFVESFCKVREWTNS